MNGYATLEAIAGELRDLQCRQKELGAAALEAIRYADEELARLLLEAFGSDDERAGMWWGRERRESVPGSRAGTGHG